MFDKVAIVGDSDLVFPLRALGIKVFSPKSENETVQIIRSLEKENIALCFLHERYLGPLADERKALEKKVCPVVVGFSDYREVTDHLKEMLRNMAVKATGSDSLLKRRG
jgi:vacuolar-type H+-ATPase subunit F/Vma7